MSKPFKTYDEQIEILSNRGLYINNPEYAKIILSQVNYYNLINGYKTPFLDNTSSNGVEDVYKAGQTAIFKKFFDENYTGKNLHDLILVLKLVIPEKDYQSLITSISSIKNKYKDKFTSVPIEDIFAISGFSSK